MGRRMCWWCSAVVLTVGLIVPLTGANAASSETGSVPAKLVGAWSRTVTQANYNKYGVGHEGFFVGVWAMVVKKSETLFYTPGSFKPGCVAKAACSSDFSATFAGNGARIVVAGTVVCSGKVTFSWKVSGQSLTLKAVSETTKTCSPLDALLEGVWKHTQQP